MATMNFKSSSEMKPKSSCEEMFGALLHSRNVAHLVHLSTKSYAEHKALNKYYDAIIDLFDGLVESYQGCYGIVTITVPAAKSEPIVPHLMKLKELCMKHREMETDGYIQNQIDTIIELIASTIYKLKFLS